MSEEQITQQGEEIILVFNPSGFFFKVLFAFGLPFVMGYMDAEIDGILDFFDLILGYLLIAVLFYAIATVFGFALRVTGNYIIAIVVFIILFLAIIALVDKMALFFAGFGALGKTIADLIVICILVWPLILDLRKANMYYICTHGGNSGLKVMLVFLLLAIIFVSWLSGRNTNSDGLDVGAIEERNVDVMGVRYNLYAKGYAEIVEILNIHATVEDSITYNGEIYEVVSLVNDPVVGGEYANSIFNQVQYAEVMDTFDVPSGIVSLNTYNLAYCNALEINLPDGLKKIESYAFTSCPNIKTIEFPDSVEEINLDRMFAQCYSLEYVELPEDCDYVGGARCTFVECNQLESVRIPAEVGMIWEAFVKCPKLKEIVLEEGITYIGAASFKDLPSLEKIVIPESVTELPAGLFCDCPNLKDVWLPDNLSDVPTSMFKQNRGVDDADVSGITIHVKKSLVDYVQNLYPTATVVAK